MINVFNMLQHFALNHKEIVKHSERILNIKSFTDKYNLEDIKYPSEKGNLKKSEKSNPKIVLNVLHAKEEEKYILATLQSKTQNMKNQLFF